MITNSILHYNIIKYIIDYGYAPCTKKLSQILLTEEDEIVKGLYTLQDYHGIVLHPTEPKIWVIHPFSLAPTNFYVQSDRGEWWGNCAWCSLGIAALLKENVTITTTIGAETKQIQINIVNGVIQEKDYFIHFPIAMKDAWDNVIYTCSNMLIFESEGQVDKWALQHDIPKGDVQSLDKIWQFAKAWYGSHLDPNWEKWTLEEAKQMFKVHGLVHEIWDVEKSEERF